MLLARKEYSWPMKNMFFGLRTLFIFVVLFSSSASAQGMMNLGNSYTAPTSIVSATAKDEAKGKQIWENLQTGQQNCSSLKDVDYEVIGEYFMGRAIGNTDGHAVMNQAMQSMMGQSGEEQMHISIGKRSSGCFTNTAALSLRGLPVVGGGVNNMMGWGWNNPVGNWGGFGFGWIFMLIFWVLLILGIVVIVRHFWGQNNTSKNNTPLGILKERYAKGEIDKKEFEEKKKDLS